LFRYNEHGLNVSGKHVHDKYNSLQIEYKYFFAYKNKQDVLFHENFGKKMQNRFLYFNHKSNETTIYDGLIQPPDEENHAWKISKIANKFTSMFKSTIGYDEKKDFLLQIRGPLVDAMFFELDEPNNEYGLPNYFQNVSSNIINRLEVNIGPKYDKFLTWNVNILLFYNFYLSVLIIFYYIFHSRF
jgi:hypothetical protein